MNFLAQESFLFCTTWKKLFCHFLSKIDVLFWCFYSLPDQLISFLSTYYLYFLLNLNSCEDDILYFQTVKITGFIDFNLMAKKIAKKPHKKSMENHSDEVSRAGRSTSSVNQPWQSGSDCGVSWSAWEFLFSANVIYILHFTSKKLS